MVLWFSVPYLLNTFILSNKKQESHDVQLNISLSRIYFHQVWKIVQIYIGIMAYKYTSHNLKNLPPVFHVKYKL